MTKPFAHLSRRDGRPFWTQLLGPGLKRGRSASVSAEGPRLRLNLALQGGGAYGAFTWGVLDRLLESPRIELGAISGASAGALNAAILASGWAEGGAEGARKMLRSFWRSLSESMSLAAMAFAPMAPAIGAGQNVAALTRFFWPNPRNVGARDPLRDLVARNVRLKRLHTASPFPLFVSATHARSFKPRIFKAQDLTLDALMASACLPHIHDPVWIEGEPYWDGGFSANPPLLAFSEAPPADATLLIRLLASGEGANADSAASLETTQKLLTFARPLEAELEEIDRLRRIARDVQGSRTGVLDWAADLQLETIDGSAWLPPAHRLVYPTAPVVHRLFGKGREAGEVWLSETFGEGQDAAHPSASIAATG